MSPLGRLEGVTGLPAQDSLLDSLEAAIARQKEVRAQNIKETLVAIKVVTPIYGGGAVAGVSDANDIIRIPAIRGALRFWWRATAGADCDSAKELRAREKAIWGGIGRGCNSASSSAVTIRVEVTKPGAPVAAGMHEVRRDGNPPPNPAANFGPNPGYALFPLQVPGPDLEDQIGPVPTREFREGVEFVLKLTAPEYMEAEVGRALRAWIVFGGYGARTRRGLGSLECAEFLQTSDAIPEWIRCNVLPGKVPATSRDWPTLAGSRLLVGTPIADAINAWNKAVSVLRDLRQGADIGRMANYHESLWPEPHALRKLTRLPAGGFRHQPDSGAPLFFPRADFGLPIGFKFKRGGGDETANGTLGLGDKVERLASPLILKVLPVRHNDRTWYAPIALVLNAPTAHDCANLKVKFDSVGMKPVTPRQVYDSSNHGVFPMKDANIGNGATDALSAFCNYFATRLRAVEVPL